MTDPYPIPFRVPQSFVNLPILMPGDEQPAPADAEAFEGFEVNTIAHVIPMSRELARLAGLIPSTPEEVADDARRQIEHEAAVVTAWGAYDVLVERLATITDPTVRAVLDLHSHNPDADHYALVCAGCDVGGMEAEPPMWPCRTVVTIAAVQWPEFEPPEAWMLTMRRDPETGKWDRP